MADDLTNDPIVDFVGSKIARYEKVVVHAPDRRGRLRPQVSYRKTKSGMSPPEAIVYGIAQEKYDLFIGSVMFVRLCEDAKARGVTDAVHKLVHQAAGIPDCVGPTLVVDTAESLGISDEKARKLVAWHDAEWAAIEGLSGVGA